jgi:TonB family protein
MRGVLVRKVAPVYPPLARQARIQGTVILQVVINKSGDVRDVQLLSGHPMLAPAAIEAVKQWKYQPYLVNGEAVEVETNVQVIFRLEGEPAPTSANAPSGVVGDISVGPSGGIVTMRADTPQSEGSPVTTHYARVSEAAMRSFRTSKVYPVYPPAALKTRVQGTVVLDIQISESGNVESAVSIAGDPTLAATATEAVRQWKYKPYLLNGSPVQVETTVRLNYSLSGENDSDGVVSEPSPDEALPQIPRLAPPQRIRVSSGVAQGLLATKVSPLYPREAREQYVQGVVLLKVNIDKEGNVYKVELISGHPLLAPAAIDAVKQWTYKPYLLNGIPVEVETQVQVNFTLIQH